MAIKAMQRGHGGVGDLGAVKREQKREKCFKLAIRGATTKKQKEEESIE